MQRLFFFFNDTGPTEIYALPLHAALRFCFSAVVIVSAPRGRVGTGGSGWRASTATGDVGSSAEAVSFAGVIRAKVQTIEVTGRPARAATARGGNGRNR